jgi:hypothetical protein
MSMRGRLLLAVALTAAFVFAAAYYGRQGNGTDQSGSTPEARRDGIGIAEPTDRPVTEALPRDQREGSAEDQSDAAGGEPLQVGDLDEQIRSFTIPIERAVAGMENVGWKIPLPPIPEFKETLGQFAVENDDPNWSLAMEMRILSEIAQATGLSAGNINVDCRATMCRVLLTKPGSAPNARYGSFNELVDSFGLKTIWMLVVPDENGTPINFAYIQRAEGSITRSESQ